MGCAISYDKLANGKICPFDGGKVFEFDDRTWCPFHLPTTDLKGNKSCKFNWTKFEQQEHFHDPLNKLLAAAIESGATLDLSFAVFPWDLLIRTSNDGRIDPAKPFRHVSISFERAKFEAAAFFQGVPFGHGTSFHGTVLHGRADFRASRFMGDAYFWNASFEDI